MATPTKKSQIVRNNHFVPQAYLRRWSDDGHKIYAYRTLVADSRQPLWELKSVRSVAFHRHLYTGFADGEEVDEFETWIKSEFEDPVMDVLDRVWSDSPLRRHDWERLAMFVAAQDMRTPTRFLESMERWSAEIPASLERSIRGGLARSCDHRRPRNGGRTDPADSLSNFIDVQTQNNGSRPTIVAKVNVGRGFWLACTRYVLTGSASIARQHKWSIVSPHGTAEWFTSDHPVLRLNYYEPGKYDFKGGWGNEGTEIMCPLTPRHLLYTQIGREAPDSFAFPAVQTNEIQRFLAERAHRWVFARNPTGAVGQFRPRRIDPATVGAERDAWDKWHDAHRSSELGSHRD